MARSWIDDDGNFTMGKYKGEPVDEVADENPGYIRWILAEVDELAPDEEEIFESLVTGDWDWRDQ